MSNEELDLSILVKYLKVVINYKSFYELVICCFLKIECFF